MPWANQNRVKKSAQDEVTIVYVCNMVVLAEGFTPSVSIVLRHIYQALHIQAQEIPRI